MMNVIIINTGTNVGGMEVLFSGLMTQIINNNDEIYLITRESDKNIYPSLVDMNNEHMHMVYQNSKDVFWMNKKERLLEKKNLLNQLGDLDFDNSIVLIGHYLDLLYAINLFEDIKIRMLMVWPHPLNFSNRLYLVARGYHFNSKRFGRHYAYQRKLLQQLDDCGASYYTSYAIRDYNQWYYDLKFDKRVIEGLPIQTNCGADYDYPEKHKLEEFKVLWVGRFDYFKNDAIVHINDVLNDLSRQHQDIKFLFNIVGYGMKKYEDDIKDRLSNSSITVNFLGGVSPDNLTSVFSVNDVGIAMGVTVKQMAYTGLPAILIDSLNKKYQGNKRCNWVFDIATGDDGDGFYYQLQGKPLENRKELKSLLLEVIEKPKLLKAYSKKGKEHVICHYMYERQNNMILDRAQKSTFTGYSEGVYSPNFLLRLLWNVKNTIKRRK